MNCQDAHILLHGLMDGELDLVTSMRVEEHLNDCVACSQAYQQYRQGRAMVTPDLYARIPAAARNRVLNSIHQAEPARRQRMHVPSRSLAAAAVLAVVIGATWMAGHLGQTSSRHLLAMEVRSSHVRSLMLNHLTDVLSADQHTVKPWFNGKLDFSPVVVDPANEGFPLVGGRLDYLNNRPVAALVYRHRQHVINLFTWPGSGRPDQAVQAMTQQGYHVYCWANGGMSYWAVSDLNDAGMEEFVRLIRQHIASVPTTTPSMAVEP